MNNINVFSTGRNAVYRQVSNYEKNVNDFDDTLPPVRSLIILTLVGIFKK